MNNEKCFQCKKPMGNSLNTFGFGGKKVPIHKHCEDKLDKEVTQ